MTIELNPDQEQIIQQQLANGQYKSVDEVLDSALSNLARDRRFDPDVRREAVRQMLEFSERRAKAPGLGEPVTRAFLHEGHDI